MELGIYTDMCIVYAPFYQQASFPVYSMTEGSEVYFDFAYPDETRGMLKITVVDSDTYPGKIFPDGIFHLYDYQFFFRNLQQNVNTRVSAWPDEN